MANVTGKNSIYADTIGILSTTPVAIRGVNFYPAAVSNVFQLKYWIENPLATVGKTNKVTYTITKPSNDHVLTATTTSWTSAWADSYVMKCIKTTGSDTNKYGLIKTAGDNTVVTVWYEPFTVEATKNGRFECYASYVLITGLLSGVTNTHESQWYDLGGIKLPNLALENISTSARVEIALG